MGGRFGHFLIRPEHLQSDEKSHLMLPVSKSWYNNANVSMQGRSETDKVYHLFIIIYYHLFGFYITLEDANCL